MQQKVTKLLVVFILWINAASASHMCGGYVRYEYMGVGSTPTAKIYKLTLYLYKDNDCVNCPSLPNFAQLHIVKTSNSMLIEKPVLPLHSTETVSIITPGCINNQPFLNYILNTYTYTTELQNSSLGYSVTYQQCCRPALTNVMPTVSLQNSLTYYATIPPVNFQFHDTLKDNSPIFKNEVAIICANQKFSFDFSAVDPDGNPMKYEFGPAYESSATDTLEDFPAYRPPIPMPAFTEVTYTNGFSYSSPLGPDVTIDRQTGIISGVAPDPGKYLVSVIVRTSYRNAPADFSIAHRKDFIITVAACDVPGAYLKPDGYSNCKDYALTFENLVNSPLNLTYDWDFGDPASGAANVSNAVSPTHIFSAAGDYDIKLVVNKGTACSDSAITKAKIYPGFYPGFTDNTPQCVNAPVQFTDTTKTDHGVVNYWFWDFGAPAAIPSLRYVRDPLQYYTDANSYQVRMIVKSSKGCIDTVYKQVEIIDRPRIKTTNDTLICSIDTLKLEAKVNTLLAGGIITWSPNYRIDDIHSFTPLVNPQVTTTYHATYTNGQGCDVMDSIVVRVVDSVTLHARSDTAICSKDPVKLTVESDGLYYLWTPATDLDNPLIKSPVARPAQSRVYHVRSSIGKCIAEADIAIKATDYPKANAGQDTAICLGTSAYLHATGGAYYFWSPAVFLNANNIPDPVVVNPTAGIKYIVTVRDTLGCPKPVRDTVLVTVVNIKANAGRDTAVVLGQPLQLQATGATSYVWEPATWLNNPNISNPLALPETDIEYRLRASDASGCYGLDSIKVKVYNLSPGLYPPNAFTPNGDGLNDFFKPIPLGMKSMAIFRIYNRAGQLVYTGTDAGPGWDGKIKGMSQSTDTFVWYAEGIDYLDKKIQRKGSVILIR